MSVLENVGGILLLVCAVVNDLSVMFQESKGNGMQALSGSNESSYIGKAGARTTQAMLIKITKITGIIFVVVTLAVYLISAAL